MRHMTLARVACLLITYAAATSAQEAAPRPVVPTEPIAAIVEAFRSHDLVAFPDAHGHVQNHEFRLAMIRDPRFQAIVNDIVIELGSARYQELADRYARGEEVPLTSLRRIWQDTTVPTGGNNYAMMQELFETVRAVNARLPRERQLRIILGDPPIDWDAVRTREDHRKWIALRDSYPAAVVQLEVLAKQRKALLVYGQLHFQRRNVASNYDMTPREAQTIVSLIELATPVKVFTIWQQELPPVKMDQSSWPVPSIALVRGTALGAADFALYAGRVASSRVAIRDGKVVPVPREDWRTVKAEDQIDAVLYLGPPAAMTVRQSHEIPRALCAEPGFLEMQLNRIALGAPPFEGERLKEYCAGKQP
jgi:hypothetical protein